MTQKTVLKAAGVSVARRFIAAVLFALAAVAPAGAQEASLVQVDKTRVEALARMVPVIGRLVAVHSSSVPAEIDGIVTDFDVQVGDRFKKGEVIARLDVEILKARFDLARGELGQTKADLSSAHAELKLARQEWERLKGLQSSGAFPKGRFDDARLKIVMEEAKVARAQAAVATSEAAMRLARLNLDKTVVRSPFDGVVTQRLSERGAYVRAGTPLVHLMADRRLEIEADVPFQRLSGLKPGVSVDFHLDDGSRHKARVRVVLPVENPQTRTRPVRFVPVFSALATPLADAQSVTVQIPVAAKRDVLTVHKDAIIKRNGRDLVYVVAGNAAQPRQITLGIEVGARMEVKGGLKEGESVVIRGNERLRPGAKVRVDGAGQ